MGLKDWNWAKVFPKYNEDEIYDDEFDVEEEVAAPVAAPEKVSAAYGRADNGQVQLASRSSIEMKDLVVKSYYTTDDPESSSRGAISLTCEVDGVTIELRTAVLYDNNGKIVTEDYFKDATIDVRGIVDSYNGKYQIKILSINDIDIKN